MPDPLLIYRVVGRVSPRPDAMTVYVKSRGIRTAADSLYTQSN